MDEVQNVELPDDTPLTKGDFKVALGQFVPHLLHEIGVIIDAKLYPVKSQLTTLDTKVDKLESGFDKLETTVDKLESRFDKLETTVDKLEVKIDHMPDKEEVREIVRDEIGRAFAHETFHIVPDKSWLKR